MNKEILNNISKYTLYVIGVIAINIFTFPYIVEYHVKDVQIKVDKQLVEKNQLLKENNLQLKANLRFAEHQNKQLIKQLNDNGSGN